MTRLLLLSSLLVAGLAHAEAKVGAPAPEFSLPAATGGADVSLKSLEAGHKAVVVMFIATKCPFSNGYNERMAQLARDYGAKGVAVVGINANKTEPAAEIAEHAKKNGFGFPVLRDEGHKIADAYGAQKTPEVYVVDPAGKLVYHGRIDDKHDDAAAVKSPDLKNALDAILAGKAPSVAETKAFGCSIKR